MKSVIDNKKGRVLSTFFTVKIRPSWHQQEFTREKYLFVLVGCREGLFRVLHKDTFSDGSGLGIINWVDSPFTEYTFVCYGLSLLP